VFGTHEDDALRAGRAALELAALAAGDAELSCRLGIETGEVLVAADGSVTGATVGAAARLAARASEGAVAVGPATGRLLAHAARPARRGGAALARRGLARGAPAVARRLDAPLVGRGHELELLRDAVDRVRTTRSPEGLLVLGAPGIGKSRLAWELA